jgi:hypothetical protein
MVLPFLYVGWMSLILSEMTPGGKKKPLDQPENECATSRDRIFLK